MARNGPEFEQMTKQKQKGNPRFSFLYGGENFNYYQFKVNTEKASKLKRIVPRLKSLKFIKNKHAVFVQLLKLTIFKVN